jgi:hypothetical protein
MRLPLAAMAPEKELILKEILNRLGERA